MNATTRHSDTNTHTMRSTRLATSTRNNTNEVEDERRKEETSITTTTTFIDAYVVS